MVNIEERLTKELDITLKQVQNVIKLLDEGNTVPFISRYRKEQTGGLSDDVLRKFFERLTYLRTIFSSMLITGPFSIILGFSGGLMALNDRLKLKR